MEVQTLTSTFAILFGALHAIEPGHGKTALFTYMASGKINWKDGIIIALSSSITHSIVVLALATLSHYFFSHVTNLNDIVTDTLRYCSALIIFLIGLKMFYKKESHSCHHCDGHNYDKSELEKNTKKTFLTSGLLGFATGLIPCPTVIVTYLAGVSSGKSYVGLKAVLLFALGMMISLVSLVVIFSIGGEKLKKYLPKESSKVNWQKVQGSVFVLIGVVTAFYH